MKTIFRYANIGLLAGAIFATGAIATFAQDACADQDAQVKLGDQFRAEYAAGKDPVNRRKAVATGKAFLEKYGSCAPAKELADYLTVQIPKMEKAIKDAEEADKKNAIVGRFDKGLAAKNWDEVYAAGKDILNAYPEDFRTVEIVLASIAGEEAFKANFKYNDEGIRLAKQSIADLEAGKPFVVGKDTRYGLADAKAGYNFAYANKDDALSWMNLYVGYMIQVGKKDKTSAAPYLYRATQSAIPEVSKNPVPYALIGDYYFEELNKVVEKIQAAAKLQDEKDAPEVAQKKIDDIKALVAMSNGISERAMDAFSRAYTYGKDAAYKAKMKKNVAEAYKVRFAKDDGVDAWIATTVAKPFVSPTTPVAPVSDPEPAKTTTGTTTSVTPATTAAPAKPAPVIKPKNR
jgi:hypothetical protein